MPDHWVMSSIDVFNFRIWCEQKGGDFIDGETEAPIHRNEIVNTLKNWGEGIGSPSTETASETLREVLQSRMADGSQMWEVHAFLSKLNAKDSGFDLNIVTNTRGVPTGVVWKIPYIHARQLQKLWRGAFLWMHAREITCTGPTFLWLFWTETIVFR